MTWGSTAATATAPTTASSTIFLMIVMMIIVQIAYIDLFLEYPTNMWMQTIATGVYDVLLTSLRFRHRCSVTQRLPHDEHGTGRVP